MLMQGDDVESGTWIGEGDAGAQRDHATKHPHQEEQFGIGQGAGDVFGGEKNRGADDAADQEKDGIEQGKPANQCRLRFRPRARSCCRNGREIHPLSNPEFVG